MKLPESVKHAKGRYYVVNVDWRNSNKAITVWGSLKKAKDAAKRMRKDEAPKHHLGVVHVTTSSRAMVWSESKEN